MRRVRAWRFCLDPQDPDYVDPREIQASDDFDEPFDDAPDYLGPPDYEGTARYHY